MITYLLDTLVDSIKTSLINKLGLDPSTEVDLDDFPQLIDDIPILDSVEELTVTENGTYTGTEGVTYNPVNVNLPLGSKSVTANGTYTASDDSLQGYSEVTVDIDDTDLYRDTTDSTYESVKTLSNCGAFPMLSLKVGIEPIQSGSGDPSPENIRPIIGWDEANVSVCGTNVWDEEWEVGGFWDNGNPRSDFNGIRSKNYIPTKPNLTMSATFPFSFVFFYDKDKTVLSYAVTNTTFTTPENCAYFKFATGLKDGAYYGTTYNNDISINYPSTDTSYHTYNGTTKTITWSSQGTLYKAEINLTTGKGQIMHKKKVLDGTQTILQANWLPTSNGVGWTYPYSVLGDSKIVTSGVPNMLCNSLEVKNYNAIYQGDLGITLYYSTYASICLRQANTSLTTKKLINAYLAENPIEIVYELATPIEFTLTPEEIKLLKGTNNIWADTGDVGDVRYFKKVEL